MNYTFRIHKRIVCLTIRRARCAKNIRKSLCQRTSTPPDLRDVVQRRLKFNFVLGVYGRRCENRNVVARIDVETPAIKWITSILINTQKMLTVTWVNLNSISFGRTIKINGYKQLVQDASTRPQMGPHFKFKFPACACLLRCFNPGRRSGRGAEPLLDNTPRIAEGSINEGRHVARAERPR